jgi:hypothetical protein
MLCGIEKTGKTTIRRWLFNEISKLSEIRYNATTDFETQTQRINDTEIVFWDLAGGREFFNRFVGEDPENDLSVAIFTGIDTLVYIVDSIEIKDMSHSRKYLNLCLKNTTKYSPMAAIFILQHKIDLIPMKIRKEVYHTIKDYLFKDITQHLWYYETSMINTSIVVAMCAIYQSTLGYIPNNVIPEPLIV